MMSAIAAMAACRRSSLTPSKQLSIVFRCNISRYCVRHDACVWSRGTTLVYCISIDCTTISISTAPFIRSVKHLPIELCYDSARPTTKERDRCIAQWEKHDMIYVRNVTAMSSTHVLQSAHTITLTDLFISYAIHRVI
jgi:hypothetical protein